MTYHVLYTADMQADIAAQVEYLQSQGVSADTIEEWFSGLFRLVDSLYEHPRRFSVAEAETAALGLEIRRAGYGQHLIFYRVSEQQKLVEVLSFRHGATRTQT
jgi:plasmid stabilization system protein ParE